jgi:hypothetical protein
LCNFPDKSIFEGSFNQDEFDGFGKYTWGNNDVYIGEWKMGKMDGEGEFKHNDGHILKGIFKQNYFLDKDRFVNPFLNFEDLEEFREKNDEYKLKQKNANEKFSRANIFKASNKQEMINSIETSLQNNKIPLIIRSI